MPPVPASVAARARQAGAGRRAPRSPGSTTPAVVAGRRVAQVARQSPVSGSRAGARGKGRRDERVYTARRNEVRMRGACARILHQLSIRRHCQPRRAPPLHDASPVHAEERRGPGRRGGLVAPLCLASSASAAAYNAGTGNAARYAVQ